MNNKKTEGGFKLSLILIIAVLTAFISLNIYLISKTDSEKVEAEGQMRLSNIAGRVENSLYQSECLLDSVASNVEQMIKYGGDVDKALKEYFVESTIDDITSRSDGSCFSAYAAYKNKLYISDFTPGEDFVLTERSWYVEAKKRRGAVNFTEPYIDASTDNLCYTISKLLSDGETVVALDFTLHRIQNYIMEMNESNSDSTSMIVNGTGMIIGHSDVSFVGQFCKTDKYKSELVNKVFMLYGESFNYSGENAEYTVFSEKTKYDWYLIVTIKRSSYLDKVTGISLYIIIFMLVFSIVFVIFYIFNYKAKMKAEAALNAKENFIAEVVEEIKRPLDQISYRAGVLDDGSDFQENGEHISASAKEIRHILDNFFKVPEELKHNANLISNKSERSKNHKKQIFLITFILLITSVLSIAINTSTQVNWGNTKMQKEAEVYYYQVKEWINNNKTALNVISDSISAQPDFFKDYEDAVEYLDDIVSKYDDISVAYICNPEWEHTVIMNNGWEPESSWHVEERQWYIDTLLSIDNFNIATPYMDEQTGYYCTTFSKMVYDKSGNFLGVLGIDYYLDKLIGILGESYTDTGYAFLTDVNGIILNHPYEQYQMKIGDAHNASDLCYRSAFSKQGNSYIKDYDGKFKVCLAIVEDVSGFSVLVVKDFEFIYGTAVYSDIVFLLLFTFCIVMVLVIMRNLTKWQERINVELQEAAENAINAGKAKNDFLANMSHEIRTPINAVLGMNEMILRESSDAQILEYSENIQSAGRTLLSLINDILDFSKIESGKMEIVPVVYSTAQLSGDLINMLEPRAKKKGLEFITEIDPNLPAELYGDDVRIRQIITNILTNAIKYTQKGNVRFKIQLLELHDGMAKLEVSVSDTGMGIREEDISKLFSSFQRLDQQKNRNIEGTGLGIPIVARILKMMGSELIVSSVYEVGSTFSFVIEQKVITATAIGVQKKQDRKKEKTNNELKTAPDARVLIVDDNETNLLVARSLLKRTLVKTDIASSGEQCISLLDENVYDIVFLDHMMPGMDGIETLSKIKELGIAIGTKFIVLTANAIQGARQSYIDAGFDDYLSKPINSSELESCLFKHISSSLIEKNNNKDDHEHKKNEVEERFDIGSAFAGFDGDEREYLSAVYDFCDNNRSNDLELDKNIWDMRAYSADIEKIYEEADLLGITELVKGAKELKQAVLDNDRDRIEELHISFIKDYRDILSNIETAVKLYFDERKS